MPTPSRRRSARPRPIRSRCRRKKKAWKPRPEADNLVGIYAALSGRSKAEVLGEFGGGQFSSFKNALVELCVTKLSPIASEMKRLVADPAMSIPSWSTAPTAPAPSPTKPCVGQGYRRLRPQALTRHLSRASAASRTARRLSGTAAPWQHGSARSIGTCMTTQRRSYETGHKPKCLVIVDDTAEWDRAVYYASRWAVRVGGGVVMLRLIEIEDQNQQWLGVADIMRAEAQEDANAALDRASGRANGIAAITPNG